MTIRTDMKIKRHTLRSVLAVGFLLLGSTQLLAETRVLTKTGELAKLALTTDAAGSGPSELVLLVGDRHIPLPEGGGIGAESLDLLDSNSGNLIASWLHEDGEGFALYFATWNENGWSGVHSLDAAGEEIRLPVRPLAAKSEDRIHLAAENSDGESNLVELERQIIHVVWQENDLRIRYSPLIFQNGSFVGWNEIVTLTSAYTEAHSEFSSAALPEGLADLTSMRSAADGSLVVLVTDEVHGRVGTVHIAPVSLAMELLSDAVLDGILDSADLFDPDDATAIADEIRGEIIHVGSRLDFDPNFTEFMSDRVVNWIQQNGSDFGWDLVAFAEATRFAALDLGRSVYSINVPNPGTDTNVTLLDIGDFLDGNGHRDDLARLLRLRVVSDFDAPPAVPERLQVHLPADGASMALSWEEPQSGTVSWTENRGQGWSDVRSLATSPSLKVTDISALIDSSLQ